LNRTRTRLLAFFALFLMLPPAAAQTAREQLERFSEGLESLHAGFSQVVVSSDGSVQDRSGGEVWLSRPGRFRWEYGGDFPELVVADGSRIWVYDEMLEQVTVKDQAEAESSSPLSLLTDPARLDEQFEVREAGATDEAVLLELRAKSMETEFERFLIGMADDAPLLMIMEDAFGLRTEIRFSGIERNPGLDAGLFEFTPPEGTDVIGALSGWGEQR
jgi:outer membrane lipoprotein carrier protein